MENKTLNIYEKLSNIQVELKAPKSQRNDFGKYNYRSAEDILEAAKPLCAKYKTVLTLSDNVYQLGERYYVQVEAKLINCENASEIILVTAHAREEEVKKGMDGSQITGASSSYARKYALNGLFNIDDTKDSDYTNNAPKTKISKAQINEMNTLGVNLANVLKKFKVSAIEDLTEEQAEYVIGAKKRALEKEKEKENADTQ